MGSKSWGEYVDIPVWWMALMLLLAIGVFFGPAIYDKFKAGRQKTIDRSRKASKAKKDNKKN